MDFYVIFVFSRLDLDSNSVNINLDILKIHPPCKLQWVVSRLQSKGGKFLKHAEIFSLHGNFLKAML